MRVEGCSAGPLETRRVARISAPWARTEQKRVGNNSPVVTAPGINRFAQGERFRSARLGSDRNQGRQLSSVGAVVYRKAKAAGLGREIPTNLFLQEIRD